MFRPAAQHDFREAGFVVGEWFVFSTLFVRFGDEPAYHALVDGFLIGR